LQDQAKRVYGVTGCFCGKHRVSFRLLRGLSGHGSLPARTQERLFRRGGFGKFHPTEPHLLCATGGLKQSFKRCMIVTHKNQNALTCSAQLRQKRPRPPFASNRSAALNHVSVLPLTWIHSRHKRDGVHTSNLRLCPEHRRDRKVLADFDAPGSGAALISASRPHLRARAAGAKVCFCRRRKGPPHNRNRIRPGKPQVSIGSARAARKPRCKRILIARAFPIEAFVLSRCAEAMAIECRGCLAKRWVEGRGPAWGWAEG
jgi:hypothetical protein